jgi:hypothetical protein
VRTTRRGRTELATCPLHERAGAAAVGQLHARVQRLACRRAVAGAPGRGAELDQGASLLELCARAPEHLHALAQPSAAGLTGLGQAERPQRDPEGPRRPPAPGQPELLGRQRARPLGVGVGQQRQRQAAAVGEHRGIPGVPAAAAALQLLQVGDRLRAPGLREP